MSGNRMAASSAYSADGQAGAVEGTPEESQLYVLGHPVGHSKSPAMYNAAYEALGIPWHYGLMDCETPEEAEAFLAARRFRSINVTTPYKPQAAAAADALAPEAQLAKGANLLVRAGDELVAHNVDGAGCVGYLLREGVTLADAKVVVCGTGPTALAILHACALELPDTVTLLGRDAGRARQVLDGYLATAQGIIRCSSGEHGDRLRAVYDSVLLHAASYEQGAGAIVSADVIIDATPLGMKPGDPAPFDTSLLSASQTVFDVVYGHGTTTLVAAAEETGARTLDGRGMLVAQAVASLRLVMAAAGRRCQATFDELFAIMAKAAGFDLA